MNDQKKKNFGGWGAVLTSGNHQKEIYGGGMNTSNQKMELKACIEALKAVKKKNMPTIVYSDSQYVVKGIEEWIYGWIQRKWHKVKNKELWQELKMLRDSFESIKFVHVKGHSGVPGNERADELARYGEKKTKENMENKMWEDMQNDSEKDLMSFCTSATMKNHQEFSQL
ncbi:MAG: ribonuclease H family protein [bacterium]